MSDLGLFLSQCWWCVLLVTVVSYLMGSINFAVTYTRLVKKQDIRTMGSGNAGFTNMLRCVGVVPAVMTFVFDFAKGIVSVLFARLLLTFLEINGAQSGSALKEEFTYYLMFIAGLFCVVGHSFPVFFKFKGGKGVVTTAAMMAVLDYRLLLFVLGTFLLVFIFSRIISLASITCGVFMGIWNFVITYFMMYRPSLTAEDPYSLTFVVTTTILAWTIGFFVIVKHKDNIKRLLKGEEKKIKPKTKD